MPAGLGSFRQRGNPLAPNRKNKVMTIVEAQTIDRNNQMKESTIDKLTDMEGTLENHLYCQDAYIRNHDSNELQQAVSDAMRSLAKAIAILKA